MSASVALESPRIEWPITPKEFFAPDGPLATLFKEHYSYRPAQAEFAMAVYSQTKADAAGKPLVAEAPTGSGKSLAYTAGVILAGGKLIVTTANKQLQRQLVTKDLPTFKLVADMCNVPFTFLQVMGKSNYACRLRIKEENPFLDARLVDWIFASDENGEPLNSGNMYDVPEELSYSLSEDWQHVSADDGCLGNRCGMAGECGYIKLKQSARRADVIVSNQYLLAIDLLAGFPGICIPNKFEVAVQGTSVVGVSPVTVVVDEAHEFPRILSQQTSEGIHRSQFDRYDDDIQGLADRFFFQLQDLIPPTINVLDNLQQRVPSGTTFAVVIELAGELHRWANETWPQGVEPQSMHDARLKASAKRARKHADTIKRLCMETVPEGLVRVLCIGSTKAQRDKTTPTYRRLQLDLVQWDVSDLCRSLWPGDVDSSGRVEADYEDEYIPDADEKIVKAKSWNVVFCSATLRSVGSYENYLTESGFNGVADTLTLPHVFDYRKNTRLYIPHDMPEDVHGDAFQHAAAKRIYELAQITNGRLFVLVTSYRKLTLIADEVARMNHGYQVLRQDRMNSKIMLEQYQAQNGHKCILFGTATFWQGVDIPGDALSQVVICGMPFPVPDDPVFQARKDSIIARTGRDQSFMLLMLPPMSLQLRQGFGRLIRRANDQGVVTILDRRLISKPWGNQVRKDLPPSLIVDDIGAVRNFFSYRVNPVESMEELI